MKKPLVIIAGPTGVGKSSISLHLAERIKGEIISADSMQVYRGMDIGTAKVSAAEQKRVPHHVLDVVDPDTPYSAADYKRDAGRALEGICERGHIPVMVGGTGFYIQALLYDIDFESDQGEDADLRDELAEYARDFGHEALHKRLSAIDPEYAAGIHPNNVKRIIRALEYYEHTGEPYSQHNRRESARISPYEYVYFVMTDTRAKLYERIDRRAQQMVDNGLIDEVSTLLEQGLADSPTAIQALGYHECADMLKRCAGRDLTEDDRRELVRQIAQNTRHYAKRQLTWFKREEETVWLSWEDFRDNEDLMLGQMLEILKDKGICNDF